MQDHVDRAFHRVPGLFRRWELCELLRLGEVYRIEDAGLAADGTPLVAVYRGDAPVPEPQP